MFQTDRLVPFHLGSVRFDPVKALWFWSMLVIALIAGAPVLSPSLVFLSLILTFFTLCVGHSVGLHRCIIHRSFAISRPGRAVLAWFFVLAGLGGPLTWARLHAWRDYWQNHAQCPAWFGYRHGLFTDFVWNLHMSYRPVDREAEKRLPPDVLNDPWLRFLERTWPLHHVMLAALLFLWGGSGAVAVCLCGRVAISILAHQIIGYASHVHGHRRFLIDGAQECGTNNWWLGVISFGEGFHNNHHAFPRSARMGMNAYDLDLGWYVIKVMERAGLVDSVRAWHREPGLPSGIRDVN